MKRRGRGQEEVVRRKRKRGEERGRNKNQKKYNTLTEE